jgi:hypothetical protein
VNLSEAVRPVALASVDRERERLGVRAAGVDGSQAHRVSARCEGGGRCKHISVVEAVLVPGLCCDQVAKVHRRDGVPRNAGSVTQLDVDLPR